MHYITPNELEKITKELRRFTDAPIVNCAGCGCNICATEIRPMFLARDEQALWIAGITIAYIQVKTLRIANEKDVGMFLDILSKTISPHIMQIFRPIVTTMWTYQRLSEL